MIRTLCIALYAVLATLVATTLANDGYTVGRWDVNVFDMGTKQAPVASLYPFHLRVYYPTKCSTQCGEFRSGGMPVFLYATGFGGQVDAYQYDVVLSGIAKHGIIVVAVDREGGFALTLDYGKLGLQLQKTIGWIRQGVDTGAGLLYELQQRSFTNELLNGASRIIMGGHSTGVQIVLRNIKDTATSTGQCPDAGGVVMLSPTDGQDALGLGGDTVLTADRKLPFSAPGLIIGAELDPKSGTILTGVACAPAERSDAAFYDAWVGAVNYLNVAKVGALDILDEAADSSFEPYCAASFPNQTEYRKQYRIVVRGAIVNFIQGVILNSQTYTDNIPDIPPNSVTLNLAEEQGVGRAFTCSYVPVTEPMPFELQTGLILFGFFFAITFITGLYCFFRKMDDDTLHRYHPAEGVGYDQPASFQTKLEPQYGVSQDFSQPQNSFNLGSQASRIPSINV